MTIILNIGLAVAGGPAFAQTPTPAATPEVTPVATATVVETPAPTPVETPAPTPEADHHAAGDSGVTSIGGYGELHYANVNGGREGAEVDFHRLVLFVGHRFDEKMSFASEIEIEHGGEEVELEQAYLQYSFKRWLGLRGGLLLVPVGILNTHHEPPTFNGVERNSVDTLLVPTTWREGGAAVYGEPIEGLRYQVAFFNGLNAGGLSGDNGLRGSRSETSESASNDGAVAARLEYAPMLGLDLGVSYFEGGAGRQEIDESVSLRLVEADARFQRWGVALRGQVVHVWIDGAEAVNDFLTAGVDPVAPIGSEMAGYYVEGAYDVFSLAGRFVPMLAGKELSPFVRYETTNTQIAMPGDYLIDESLDRSIATAGLTFKPIPKVALKADYQWTFAESGEPDNVWHLGMGFMF